ncbi:hypothetical protein TNCV_1291471 [Trichonephila clavipes]|nr:hypothetical protein TNCV_1291471 [Trichonephila clavipes]
MHLCKVIGVVQILKMIKEQLRQGQFAFFEASPGVISPMHFLRSFFFAPFNSSCRGAWVLAASFSLNFSGNGREPSAVIRNPKYSTWAAPITDLETFIRSPYCWNLSNTIFRCSLCSSSVDEAKVHHQDTGKQSRVHTVLQ